MLRPWQRIYLSQLIICTWFNLSSSLLLTISSTKYPRILLVWKCQKRDLEKLFLTIFNSSNNDFDQKKIKSLPWHFRLKSKFDQAQGHVKKIEKCERVYARLLKEMFSFFNSTLAQTRKNNENVRAYDLFFSWFFFVICYSHRISRESRQNSLLSA